ncbi:unnamed protein product, partial [Mesorhabditis belari]|uniref:Uncharacterized protein n=1 Tax=Mesorhabditis belari TaxID=2138241 RepID=A0AAF3FFE7_9BILA
MAKSDGEENAETTQTPPAAPPAPAAPPSTPQQTPVNGGTSRASSEESTGPRPSLTKRLSCIEVSGAPPPLTIKKVTSFAIDHEAAQAQKRPSWWRRMSNVGAVPPPPEIVVSGEAFNMSNGMEKNRNISTASINDREFVAEV